MKGKGMKFAKALIIIILAAVVIVAGLLVSLKVRTSAILDDISSVRQDEEYSTPGYVDGIEVIKQDVSCGYAVMEMFSSWCGGDVTEEICTRSTGRWSLQRAAAFAKK